MRRYILILAGSVGIATSFAILSGYLMVGRGDPSNRVIISFLASGGLSGFASDWSNWSGTWPAAYFLVQGSWIRVLGALGVDDMFRLIQATLWLSVIAWMLILLGAHATVKRVAGSDWGWITVASLLAFPLLTELSHNAYAGVYFAVTFLYGLRALMEFEATGRWAWLALSGVALLAGSTLRTEAIVASAGLALVVLVRHGMFPASVFFALAGSLTLARGLLVMWVQEDVAVFFQQVPQPLSGRFVDLGLMTVYLLVPTGIVLGTLYLHLRPRRGNHVSSVLRVRLAEYAGASALALYGFFLSAMLLLPKLGPDSRFLLVPSIATIILLACLASVSAEAVWNGMRRWLAPWVVASCMAQIFLLGVDYLTDPPRMPREIREGATWLRDNVPDGTPLAIDFLYWWEDALLLYGSPSPEGLRPSHTHVTGPPATDLSLQPGDLTQVSGAYLAQYRPGFLVLSSPEAGILPGGVASYLDPWVTRTGDGFSVRPLGASGPSATGVSVFENGLLEIVEVRWASES